MLTLGENNFLNYIFGKKLFVKLHSCPIEEFNVNEKFDLIVMIDVLEHCYDFKTIMDKILKLSDKNTYFVFQDKFFNIDDISLEVQTKYDAAHPLRIRKELLLDFLGENFTTLLSKVKYFKSSRGERDLSHYCLYYIGYKK